MQFSRTLRYSRTSTSRSQHSNIRLPSSRKLLSHSITSSSAQSDEYCCIFSSGIRSKWARRLTPVSSSRSSPGSCSKFQTGCSIRVSWWLRLEFWHSLVGDSDQLLAQILARKQVQKRPRRILEAVDESFAVLQFSFRQPMRQLFSTFSKTRGIVGD